MEESSEAQYEENKALPDQNKKRRFKTPSQLQGLEDFYNEHKYPTESLKSELAEKLGLTDKQVSGWFCHRRLKDKRKDESISPGRQDLSSGVIQDRGSGLRQDSCSSTKQGDYKLADLREVESQRFCRDNIPVVEVNYEPRIQHYDGVEMDDTSSKSNSTLQDNFFPQNRGCSLDVATTEHRAPNEFVAKTNGLVGPSGYLKIKGQTEDAAITAVKGQLGRHYLEDGPSLGIEFDPLPPGAFESPINNISNDSYRVQEPLSFGSLDISGSRKRPGFSTIRDQETYVEATEYRPSHESNQDNFSYLQSKQSKFLPDRSQAFPTQKSSIGVDSYSARETSDYDGSINHSVMRKHDIPGMSSDSYSRKLNNALEKPWSPSYDNANVKARKRERLDSRPPNSMVWHKDCANKEDRVPSTGILKDEELYMERKPVSEHHDSVRLKMPPTTNLRAGKRGKEEFLKEEYGIKTSSLEPPQWSRQMKGSTVEIPSRFSEDETTETSSSAD